MRRSGLLILILLATSVVALAMSMRAATGSGRIVADLELSAEQYQRGQLSRDFTIESSRALCRLEYRAAVDNSWISLQARVLDDRGAAITELHPNLSYYHGQTGSKPWTKGRQDGAELFELPRGRYRLSISGTAGGGASSTPDPAAYSRPVRITVSADLGPFRALIVVSLVAFLPATALLFSNVAEHFRRKAVRPATTARGDPLPQGSADAPAPHARQPGEPKERFLMIDGLRGIASLAVLACHLLVPEVCKFAQALESVLPGPVSQLVHHGDLGVEIFFVLSGFVIAYSTRGRVATPAFAGRFALRRAIRLDPPYYVILILTMATWACFTPFGVAGVLDEMKGMPGILANMFYLQDILSFPSPVPIAWTLCLEVQFYLAYIVLLGLTQAVGSRMPKPADGSRGQSLAFPSTAARMLIFLPLAATSLSAWYPHVSRFDFLGCWFRFFLGVLVYWVLTAQSSRLWFFAFGVLLFGLGAWTRDARSLAALSTAVLIYGAGRAGKLATWLSARWVQYLGRISYSLYLVHIPVGISAANFLWSWTDLSPVMASACASAAIFLSIAGAAIIHRYFEAVSIRISKNVNY